MSVFQARQVSDRCTDIWTHEWTNMSLEDLLTESMGPKIVSDGW